MKGKAIAIIVLSLMVGGCSDQNGVLDPGGSGARITPETLSLSDQQASLNDTEGKTTGEQPLTTVALSLDVTGSFRPNTPLILRGTANPNAPSSDLDLNLWSPEVEFARESGWGQDYRVKTGRRIPDIETASSRGRFESPVEVSSTISIPAPGIYEIILSATATPLIDDYRLNSFVARSVWVLIDEEGGGVMNELDLSAIPDGFRKQTGPFRPILRHPSGSSSVAPAGTGASAQRSGGQDEIKAHLYFVDNYLQIPVDVEGALVNLYEYDDQGILTEEQWAETDSLGIATFECTDWDQELEGVLAGSQATVINGFFPDDPVSGYCGDPAPVFDINVYSMGRVFMNLELDIIPTVEAGFSETRSTIKVDRSCLINCNTSKYVKGADKIYIHPDHRVGPVAAQVQAHEFGHAFHEKALGGNTGSGSCPKKHTYTLKTNYECAWSEGFAEYVSAAFGYRSGYSDGYRIIYHCIDYNFQQGYCEEFGTVRDHLKVEGAVTAFLFDVTDPANETYDDVSISKAQLADVIQTCQVNRSGWRRPDRIHWLTHCVQRAIDGYRDDFPTVEEPSAYTVTSSHSAGFDDVRQLWRIQFFDKSTLYDPLSAYITGPEEVPEEVECAWQAWANGGLPPFSYSWSGALTGSSQTIFGEVGSSGWLYVTVTDSLSNQDPSSFFITVEGSAEECQEW